MFAERKITKIGNSLGVTFPIDLLNELDLNQGDEIRMEIEDDKIVIKRNNKVPLPNGISEDFFDVFHKNLKEYKETIDGLKDR